MIRIHIYYAGYVQGVGFRYSAQRMAADLGLRGWVKNLPDGRVEILAEGDKANIEKFCEVLEERFHGNIKDKTLNLEPAQGNFKEFQVAF